MRPPLWLLLALLALFVAFAGAEDPEQGTLTTRVRGWLQKAQEHFSTLQDTNVARHVREWAQTGISRTQEMIQQIKGHISKLLEKAPSA